MASSWKSIPLDTVQLLLKLKKQENDPAHLSEKLLTALNSVFPRILKTAVELVDKKSVSRIQCPSGRVFFQVRPLFLYIVLFH